jgi:hypothetical protein
VGTGHWLTPDFTTREAFRTLVVDTWALYAAALKSVYRTGRPARGQTVLDRSTPYRPS